MKIGIAADHRGFKIKEELTNYLTNKGYEIISYGNDIYDPLDDYPKYAFTLGEAVRDKAVDFGIIACGTGVGVCIACNKVKGVRCALVDSVEEAIHTRQDNNSNIISISEEFEADFIHELVDTFLNTPFSNEERHIRRLKQIEEYESKC